ncbi:hypothetical protein BP5796_10247 [Coleophoma crateriformis]|uniref:Uncharacterized protein n=1 Tax=Coleophoma crateriformis TaxID=565419 RepID=A0A3D8QUV4_9HELO|nr:hypothetical protein BP5796_10247 [Coleophoma crateriformis]
MRCLSSNIRHRLTTAGPARRPERRGKCADAGHRRTWPLQHQADQRHEQDPAPYFPFLHAKKFWISWGQRRRHGRMVFFAPPKPQVTEYDGQPIDYLVAFDVNARSNRHGSVVLQPTHHAIPVPVALQRLSSNPREERKGNPVGSTANGQRRSTSTQGASRRTTEEATAVHPQAKPTGRAPGLHSWVGKASQEDVQPTDPLDPRP